MISSSASVRLDEPAFLASFKRGRILVLMMTMVTAAFLLGDEMRKLWTDGIHTITLDRVLGWLVLGSLCWYVVRGARLAAGCFNILYGALLLGFLFVAAGAVFGSHFSAQVHDAVFDVGKDWLSALRFVALGAWVMFSLWVLLFSRDARLYMRARRQGIAEAEANAFEWPPAHRR